LRGRKPSKIQKLASIPKEAGSPDIKVIGLFCFEPQPNPGILYCNAGILGSYPGQYKHNDRMLLVIASDYKKHRRMTK